MTSLDRRRILLGVDALAAAPLAAWAAFPGEIPNWARIVKASGAKVE